MTRRTPHARHEDGADDFVYVSDDGDVSSEADPCGACGCSRVHHNEFGECLACKCSGFVGDAEEL